ncbi:MAG: cytochrome C biogenesis protein [Planctomycetota bacterium]|nr:MAG: cytochrome C biogenesis protein [Planctomycetota bacterium]REJ93305.1 MAG: cytochrome C biogenesis protein [Planctomycetota bacterium]REK30291.1 MAG: cytochrome C biogenesis protein [Planctomycetota bacterium]REK49283.1 MAG: cytochrome C biogenesis protein [Planctomycetota bacterium]
MGVVKHEDGTKTPAIRWLADVLFNEEAARQYKVFRIVNGPVLNSLGLEHRPGFYRYSLDEIDTERMSRVFAWADRVSGLKKRRSEGEKVEITQADEHAHDFANKVQRYINLKATNQFPGRPGKDLSPRDFGVWFRTSGDFSGKGRHLPALIPRQDNSVEWPTVATAMHEATLTRLRESPDVLEDLQSGKLTPDNIMNEALAASPDSDWLTRIWKMRDHYVLGQTDAFNDEVAAYRTALAELTPSVASRGRVEYFMNRFEPFIKCLYLTGIGFLFIVGSWFGWRRPLLRAACAMLVLSLFIHTLGLGARMFLENRYGVFVTNLYSSAVFIGWIVVITGLFLEWIYRNSIGLTVACTVSVLSLIVAHNLDLAGGGKDNLEVLQAVLDTNFWLATHVTIVTWGYGATFVAGALGIFFILLGVFTPLMDKEIAKALTRMIYGVVCGATMLSFIGTVLGGIWADQSWGRFWGWDPKENGALIIVLWNALILHARWGGMVRQRGMAVLAVFGNVVTTWSWFGTNMLGVGLHSYGFMDSAFFWMMLFMTSQLLIMAVGAFWPEKSWLSYEAMNFNPPQRRDGRRLNKLRPAPTA